MMTLLIRWLERVPRANHATLVNLQPAGRWTMLHQAAEGGSRKTVKALLNLGANTRALTRDPLAT